jgi:ATP-dependent Lhr-like helicase
MPFKSIGIEIEDKEIIRYLMKEYKIEWKTAKAIFRYFLEQKLFSEIPTDKKLVIEEFEEDGMFYYVFHTLIGRRANEAVSRVFAYRIGKLKDCNVQIALTDNGFLLKLPKKLEEDEIVNLFDVKDFREHLRRALDKTELLRRRFRHVAVRSFMILKNYLGKEKSVWKQQMSADSLLKLLKKYFPDFPVLRETYREIMEDFMDIENALNYLSKVGNEIELKIVKVPNPSPFALNMYLVGEEDVVLMEDKRKVLRILHEMILKNLRDNKRA